jgi:hypothetical protein
VDVSASACGSLWYASGNVDLKLSGVGGRERSN